MTESVAGEGEDKEGAGAPIRRQKNCIKEKPKFERRDGGGDRNTARAEKNGARPTDCPAKWIVLAGQSSTYEVIYLSPPESATNSKFGKHSMFGSGKR